jgi:hypothetical protein
MRFVSTVADMTWWGFATTIFHCITPFKK